MACSQNQARRLIEARCARGLADPIVGAEDVARTVAIIDAVLDAATTGRRTAPRYL